MKRFAIVAIAAACAFMAGCAQENVKQSLENLSKDCDRDYSFAINSGGVGGMGASAMVTGTAHCKHEFGVTPVPPAVVTPGVQ